MFTGSGWVAGAASGALIMGVVTLGAVQATAGPGGGGGSSGKLSTTTLPLAQSSVDRGRLDLRGTVIDTRRGREPEVPAGLRSALGGGRQLWLLQFRGPVQRSWITALRATGAIVVEPVSPYGYVVQADSETADALRAWHRRDAEVRWAGPFRPAYRLAPDLVGKRAPAADDPVDVYVQVPAQDAGARRQVRAFGPVSARMTQAGLVTFSLTVRGADLAALARQPGVVNIERRPVPVLNDEVQDQIVGGNVLTGGGGQVTPNGPGYLGFLGGEGYSTTPADHPVVAVVDDGVDVGTTSPAHSDFTTGGSGASRLVSAFDCTTGGNPQGVGGHGNLNAGIVGGFNNATGSTYEDGAGYNFGLGVDPYARLANVKVFNDFGSFDVTNCAGTLAGIAQQVVNAGAVIANNSWGAPVYGVYDVEAQTYDALVRDSGAAAGVQPVLHVFSAGNSGAAGTTIGSPGTAKNVLTVGATENVRENGVADGCGITAADNAADIATFSSRGPTADLRAKPDVVAPGTHVQGPASQAPGYLGATVCGPMYRPGIQTLYTWSSGTSHAAPAVSGAAALAYEYYRRSVHAGVAPSPAMLKALLLNSARYLNGSGTGGTLPGTGQGWGMADLGAMTDGSRWALDQGLTFTATGQDFSRGFTVVNPAAPTRVTMAFSDAPGAVVGQSWVNDLDLTVTAGGTTYKGNVFSGGQSASGGASDPRNSVEQVWLPAGITGPVTVAVHATNVSGNGVPGGPAVDQDFALTAVNLAESAPAPAPSISMATFAEHAAGANGNGSIEPGERVLPTVTLANIGSVPTAAGTLSAQVMAGPAVVVGGPVPVPVLGPDLLSLAGPVLQVRPDADCADTVTVRFTYTAGGLSATADIPFDTSLPPGTSWTTVPATGLPLVIPDASATGVTSTITAGGPDRVVAVAVRLGITHTWDGDLVVTLTGPQGQVSTLVNRRGSNGDDFVSTTFDDAAATPISAGTAPFTGSFRPESPLSVFRGTDGTGGWVLKVADLVGGDAGTLNSWELRTKSAACDAVNPGVRAEDVPGGTPEGSAMVFPLTRIGPTADAVTVAVHTQDGTAVAGSDYSAVSTSVTIPAGATGTTVSVPTAGDAVTDPGETVRLAIDSVSGFGVVVRSPGTGVITDVPVVGPTPSTSPSPPPGGGPTAPPSGQKQPQTAAVSLPRRIKFRGKTVLLRSAVTTNAGQPAAVAVKVRPAGKKYARVTTSASGKVTIRTKGLRRLKVSMALTAPATEFFEAYAYTRVWRVRK